MAVIGPSTALARIDALAAPVANRSNSRASRMVPTPIVTARLGTLSGSPPNMAAFCCRVTGVSAFSLVRDIRADMPPFADAQQLQVDSACLIDQMLVPRRLRLQIGRHAVRDVGVSTIDIHPAK